MLKSLFQFLFGSFRRKSQLAESERDLVRRMIAQAEEIANGSYITESKLPQPKIPERRNKPR